MILAAELMFCFHFKRRKYFWARFGLSVPIFIALSVLFSTGEFVQFFIIGEWFSFYFLLDFLLSLFIIWLCFDIGFKTVLFFSAAAYSIQHLTYNIIQLINPILFGFINNAFLQRFMFLLMTVIIYACIYLLLRKNIKNNEIINFQSTTLMIIVLAVIMLTYVISMWVTFDLNQFDTAYKIIDTCCCLLLLYVQFGISERARLKNERELMEQILHKEEAQHKISKENIELINLKCHDIKHQLSAIRSIDNMKEQEQNIRNIEEAIRIYDCSVKTGNDALDVVLTEKSLYCEKYHILLNCMIDGQKLQFIESVDVYSLFGNIIDNAIESVYNLTDEDKRVIELTVKCEKGALLVHAENYCEKQLKFENGLPVTTKSDKNYHGFGVKSIKYLSEKYGGTLDMFVENNIFNVNILFPVTE